ncbi:hypothetical protein BDU57DRAFT_516282 [Ampelomyces quisqualis]|uniref:Uncharacterized protein n=1 Tax=Ampelomyces quisqualis TaxID=50730 RepID=A0A6A5QNJ8_AMPQU|nr:hypothetical protein BDU57DRAFT_516282 [Ampelomyces quisqualis]
MIAGQQPWRSSDREWATAGRTRGGRTRVGPAAPGMCPQRVAQDSRLKSRRSRKSPGHPRAAGAPFFSPPPPAPCRHREIPRRPRPCNRVLIDVVDTVAGRQVIAPPCQRSPSPSAQGSTASASVGQTRPQPARPSPVLLLHVGTPTPPARWTFYFDQHTAPRPHCTATAPAPPSTPTARPLLVSQPRADVLLPATCTRPPPGPSTPLRPPSGCTALTKRPPRRPHLAVQPCALRPLCCRAFWDRRAWNRTHQRSLRPRRTPSTCPAGVRPVPNLT